MWSLDFLAVQFTDGDSEHGPWWMTWRLEYNATRRHRV